MPHSDLRTELDTGIARFRADHYQRMAAALSRFSDEFRDAPPAASLGEYALLGHVFFGVRHAANTGDSRLGEKQVRAWAQRRTLLTDTPAWFASTECAHIEDDRYQSPVFLVTAEAKPLALDSSNVAELSSTVEDNAWVVRRGAGIAVGTGTVPQLGMSRSWTVTGVPATVFTETPETDVRIAEALLHEAAHNTLNAVLDSTGTRLDDTPLWYSPWKRTDRPAFGLLHAIFAFSALVRYWDSVTHREGTDPLDVRYCRTRAEEERDNLRRITPSFSQALTLVDNPVVRELLTSFHEAALETTR